MTAAHLPIQRPRHAKLLVVDEGANVRHWPRSKFVDLLHRGDLVIANDAATLPASLFGRHVRSGRPIEVRLAGRRSLAPDGIRHVTAVVFGGGDFLTRTEHRPLPPELAAGDRLTLGPLRATVERTPDVRRIARRDLGRTRAPRPPDPVLARQDAAGTLGCLDADRRSTGCVRAAFGRLCARLEYARVPPGARGSVCNHHPRCRHLVHWGHQAGRSPAVR